MTNATQIGIKDICLAVEGVIKSNGLSGFSCYADTSGVVRIFAERYNFKTMIAAKRIIGAELVRLLEGSRKVTHLLHFGKKTWATDAYTVVCGLRIETSEEEKRAYMLGRGECVTAARG